MTTIAVVLVNVDDLDEYIGNVSDDEFDKKTEEYIQEEVGRGNFFDTRIRYLDSNETTISVHSANNTSWCTITNGNVTNVDSTDNTLSEEDLINLLNDDDDIQE